MKNKTIKEIKKILLEIENLNKGTIKWTKKKP